MKRLLFLLFLLAGSPVLHAQGYDMPEVVISNEKANIGGKVYYVHKVLPKQTLFSICKAYGIRDEDLAAVNPGIKDGLKAGSIIFIPAGNARPQDSADTARTNANKETVTAEPAPEKTEPEKMESALAPSLKRVAEHRVRWYESLAGIARKYDVPEKTIRDYNGLSSTDPIRGKVLLIPFMGETSGDGSAPDPDADTFAGTDPAAGNDAGEAPMTPVRRIRWFSADEPLRIALVLPFNLDRNNGDSFYLNFYSGALMAVRDQKEKGAHLILNVYDLAQGAEAILTDPKFKESDLVVGPVEASSLAPFLAFSDKNGIPVVSPLDQKVDSLVENHPFLFQVPASAEVQVANLVRSLHARSDETVLLLIDPSASDTRLADRMEALLQTDGVSYRKVAVGDMAGLMGPAVQRKPAKILIGSENNTFTAEVIRSLNALAKRNIAMEIWCTNRVRNFETSDPDALFNLRAHTSAPYFVDYSDPRDQDFVRRYRALFYAEPDDFAFQGYDIFTCFITAAMQHGTAFFAQAEEYPMQLLHCNLHFVRKDGKSGWRNSATRNLVYDKDDFSIAISK